MSQLTPRNVLVRHAAIITILASLHLFVVFMDGRGEHKLFGLARLFRLSDEGNIPSCFSALALLLTGGIALTIANRLGQSNAEERRWRVLGTIFILMAMDEVLSFHERFSKLGEYLGSTSPVFDLGVYPYAMLAALLSLFYFRWWIDQRSDIRALIAAAGFCYVASAIGVEFIEYRLTLDGVDAFTQIRGLLFFVEETGEMIAVALFLNAFLRRLAALGGGPLTVCIIAPERNPAAGITEGLSSTARTA